MKPIKVSGACARTDAELLVNMQAAMQRGLPELRLSGDPRPPLIVAASGPSIASYVDTICELRLAGAKILAIRGAHDFLIEHGIVPDYALTVDPLPDSWKCFQKKHPAVEYLIAAQCPSTVFDHLSDCNVTLWYPFIGYDTQHPGGKLIIAGGSTSGLRGLSVAYVMGYRDLHLFGFDCCMSGDALRVDGSGLKATDKLVALQLEEGGEVFHCNGAMAHQAQQFENCYDVMPDVTFTSYGHGLITAILAKRQQQLRELEAMARQAGPDNRVSFIHSWNEDAASYRYRAMIPAKAMGATLNDLTAGTLIFAKPQAHELIEMGKAKARGAKVIVDFCDPHFDWPYYKEALRLADVVTCPTREMAEIIRELGREAVVVPDPYEYQEMPPHCDGTYVLWFGHASNKGSLERVISQLNEYPLRVVSNFGGAIPWSHDTMLVEFGFADIVIIPATEKYKSANRAVEAIRQGCFVVAEPHPALNDIPGIWIGNIKEGIEWAKRNPSEAQSRTSKAQKYVMERYSPRTVTAAWRRAMGRPTTSDAATESGPDGSTSMLTTTAHS